jgi:hypothetical protein
MTTSEMIANRQKANLAILEKIKETINSHPELRFGQLLVTLGIIEYNYDKICDVFVPKDIFHEESVITLNKLNKTEK